MRRKVLLTVAIVFSLSLISAEFPECDSSDSNSDTIFSLSNVQAQQVCTDADGDGFFMEEACGDTVDCDDGDPENWVSCDTCLDIDGDGWYAGCDLYTVTQGPDCDDNDGYNWVSCDSCFDNDGDGYYGEGCDDYVSLAYVDCDDGDSLRNPGMTEYSCDFIDSNCDGMDGIACYMEWNPVCGMDGMTYGNDCEALNWGCTQIACMGECPCSGGGGIDNPF